MPRIKQLPQEVVSKIAAGEVIERPASVLKELLENSLDAGATRVDIDVEQGGVELIRVVDDGCGIEPEDLELAFCNHATSKLSEADDLFRIHTLGFRGEALASVGSVAKVTLQSRPRDAACGAEIRCQGAVLSTVRAWNGAVGTRIEVRDLFYNTPVRRKFLRTTATEIGHICEMVTRIALACPHLHVVLRHNQKLIYEVPASAGLLDRIGIFFGSPVRDALYPVRAQQGDAALTGFIADPSCDQRNASRQYFFVNGRWVRDRMLSHALQESYRGLLMTGRHAVAFLYLQVPPDWVDVNVHPTKAEVRFRESDQLYRLIRSAVREKLNQTNLIPRLVVAGNSAAASASAAGGASPAPPPPAPWELPPAASASPSATVPPPTPWELPPAASASPSALPTNRRRNRGQSPSPRPGCDADAPRQPRLEPSAGFVRPGYGTIPDHGPRRAAFAVRARAQPPAATRWPRRDPASHRPTRPADAVGFAGAAGAAGVADTASPTRSISQRGAAGSAGSTSAFGPAADEPGDPVARCVLGGRDARRHPHHRPTRLARTHPLRADPSPPA
jgi:DNA mismatch repair protein MutL